MSMKPEEKLLKAFGDIDEKYIIEAAPSFDTGSPQVTKAAQLTGNRRRVRTYNRIIRFAGTAAAAVIVLIAAAGVLRFVRTGSDSAPLTQQSVTTGADSAFSKISQEEADLTEEYALEEAAPAAAAFTAETPSEESEPDGTAETFSAGTASQESAPAAGAETGTEAATEAAALKQNNSQDSLDSDTGIAGVTRYDSLSEAENAAGIMWDQLNPVFKADVQEITEGKTADHYMASTDKMLGICFVNSGTSDYTEVYAERITDQAGTQSVIDSIVKELITGNQESIVRTDDHGTAVIREDPADGTYAVQWNDGEFVYLTISKNIPEWVRQYFGN